MKHIRWILFDLGGTLIHLNQSDDEILLEQLKKRSLLPQTQICLKKMSSDTSIDACSSKTKHILYATDIMSRYGIEMCHLGSVISAVEETRQKIHAPSNWIRDEKMIMLLTALKSVGYQIGILSNWDHSFVDFIKYFDLESYVDEMFYSKALGCEKPNKQIFYKVMRILEITSEEILYIGNEQENDYDAPMSMGIQSLLIDRPEFDEFLRRQNVKNR